MIEMTIGIQKIAESANSIVDSSTETNRDVALGRETMKEVTTQMISIRICWTLKKGKRQLSHIIWGHLE